MNTTTNNTERKFKLDIFDAIISFNKSCIVLQLFDSSRYKSYECEIKQDDIDTKLFSVSGFYNIMLKAFANNNNDEEYTYKLANSNKGIDIMFTINLLGLNCISHTIHLNEKVLSENTVVNVKLLQLQEQHDELKKQHYELKKRVTYLETIADAFMNEQIIMNRVYFSRGCDTIDISNHTFTEHPAGFYMTHMLQFVNLKSIIVENNVIIHENGRYPQVTFNNYSLTNITSLCIRFSGQHINENIIKYFPNVEHLHLTEITSLDATFLYLTLSQTAQHPQRTHLEQFTKLKTLKISNYNELKYRDGLIAWCREHNVQLEL